MTIFSTSARRFLAGLLTAGLILSMSNTPAFAALVRVAPEAMPTALHAANVAPTLGAFPAALSLRPLGEAPAALESAAVVPGAQAEASAAVPSVSSDRARLPSPVPDAATVQTAVVDAKVLPLLKDPFERRNTPEAVSVGVGTPGALAPAPAGASLRVKRTLTAVVVGLPFVGFATSVWYFWGHGIDWLQTGIMVSLMALTELGITAGYHRLFTHRSFEASPRTRAAFAILGSMAVEGSVFDWVAQHRIHHRSSDQVGDPHSPHLHGTGLWGTLKGFGYSHIGWFFKKDPVDLHKYVRDLAADPVISRINRQFPMWIIAGLVLPAALGGLLSWSWTGAWLGLFWGGGARLFLLHHITWSINSVCHLWGPQHFESKDQSRNNPVMGLLAFGEGWHNNHHAFPRSARHGLLWWQFDISYLVILGLSKLGLVQKIHVPSAEAQAEKRLP
jgi:stearoyl-CoA desaturase (delta-9 desaturase)